MKCTVPIDPTACLACASGYTFNQNKCQACDANCKTCSQFTSSCTSCHANQMKSLLVNNRCVAPCIDQGFFLDLQSFICLKCSSACQECTSANSCSSCPFTTYLSQGQCLPCHFSCSTCYGTDRKCIRCATNYQMKPDGTCQTGCVGGIIVDIYGDTFC